MKSWSEFLACLLLSAGIWLVYNLIQTHSSTVNVQVIALSSLPGRSERSSEAVQISARCSASGFRLMRGNSKRVRAVRFDAADFTLVEGDRYSISPEKLYDYTTAIFGQGVNVEAFITRNPVFRFMSENNRKVPVRAVKLLSFRPQYMQSGVLTLEPDSVTVYGSPELLERVHEVFTSALDLDDLSGSVRGTISLETPSGVRLSQNSVEYNIDVSRYVEIQVTSRITVVNAPAGVDVAVYPPTAAMTFRCEFPLIADPQQSVRAVVDYSDFENSIRGRCPIHVEGVPKGVLSVKLEPEVADCVLRETTL